MGPELQTGDLLYSLDGFLGMIVNIHEADQDQRLFGTVVYDVEWYTARNGPLILRRQYADIVYDMRVNYLKRRETLLS